MASAPPGSPPPPSAGGGSGAPDGLAPEDNAPEANAPSSSRAFAGGGNDRAPVGPLDPPPPARLGSGLTGAFAAMLLLSVLGHAVLWAWGLPLLADWQVDLFDRPVAIDVIDASSLSTFRPDRALPDDLVAVPEVLPEEPEEELIEPPKEDAQQIVEVPSSNPVAPEEAEYLAEHNNLVPKEMRSEAFRLNPEVLADRFSPEDRYQMEDALDVGATSVSTGATVGGVQDDAPGRGAPRSLLPSEWALTNKEGVAAPTLSSSREQALAGAPQNDLLDEVVGDRTALNTREFYGAQYLNLIRRQVNFYWQQNIDNLPPNLPIAKSRYLTSLDVVLDGEGRIESLVVTGESGLEDIDLCLVNAFRQAQPFPNPPAQLVARDGRIYLPDFNFTLEFGHAELPYAGIDPRAGVQFPGIMRAPR